MYSDDDYSFSLSSAHGREAETELVEYNIDLCENNNYAVSMLLSLKKMDVRLAILYGRVSLKCSVSNGEGHTMLCDKTRDTRVIHTKLFTCDFLKEHMQSILDTVPIRSVDNQLVELGERMGPDISYVLRVLGSDLILKCREFYRYLKTLDVMDDEDADMLLISLNIKLPYKDKDYSITNSGIARYTSTGDASFDNCIGTVKKRKLSQKKILTEMHTTCVDGSKTISLADDTISAIVEQLL